MAKLIRCIIWMFLALIGILPAFIGCINHYTKVKYSNDIGQIRAYIKEYPKSKHIPEAKALLEDLVFKEVQNKRTIAVCDSFLVEFPQGRHVVEIRKIKNSLIWSEVKATNNIDKIKIWIKENLDSEHISEANELLSELTKSLEDAIFVDVQNKRTIAACDSFLAQFPKGKYVSEVIKIKHELIWLEVKATNNIGKIKGWMAENPDSNYLLEAKRLIEDLVFADVKRTYTMQACSKYETLYKNGRYLAEIQKIKDDINLYEETKKKDTIKDYLDFAEKFTRSRFASEARKRATSEYWHNKKPGSDHALIQLAEAFMLKRNYAAAKKYYQQAIEINPKNSLALSRLGKIHYDDKEYDEALNLLIRAKDNGSTSYETYYYLGRLYSYKNSYQETIEYFDKAIQSVPDSIEAYYYRGECHHLRANSDQAKRDFQKVIVLASGEKSQYPIVIMAKEYIKQMK